MKKLDLDQKCYTVGGAISKSSTSVKYKGISSTRNKSSGIGVFFKKNIKSYNYFAHNIGLAAMTLGATISNIWEIYSDIKEEINKNKTNNYHNKLNYYTYNNRSYGNYSKYNNRYRNSIKPSIRFGAYPHRDAIAFNLPWFY